MSEIEIKLHATPARLRTVLARLGRKAAKGSAFRKTLRAVYFDTAKDDLHAKGLSLRVRDEGGRFIQTLKQVPADQEALTRGEWSDEVAGASPELLKTKSGRRLRRVWKDVRLLPRFTTQIQREGFVLSPRRGVEVEVVRDHGEIRAIGRDDEIARVSEIELEVKRGAPEAIYALALQIARSAPVRIEARAKSDRGYALLSPGAGFEARRADASNVHGRETLAEVLRSAARRHFGQFLGNMPGALKHDPASIHQMRVAMRRLRSALYAVRDQLPEAEYESVRANLRHLLQSLGAARDWEVLTERISELDAEEREAALDARRVQNLVKTRKNLALNRATAAVGSPLNTKAVLEAMLWFERLPQARFARKLGARAEDAAPGLLDGLFNRVRRRGRHFERQSVDDRHRLRIACKNLRYNIELYRALYDRRKVEKFLRQLKPVQDDLGHLNDVSRARDLLGGLAKRSPQRAAADAVIARLEARVAAAEERSRKHIAKLRDARPFW